MNIEFSTAENGYSKPEVERYIDLLQSEYKNAVAWSNNVEQQIEKLKSEAQVDNNEEIIALKAQNSKLFNDCRMLALKLKEMTDIAAEKNKEAETESAGITEEANAQIAELSERKETLINEIKGLEKISNKLMEEVMNLKAVREERINDLKSLDADKAEIQNEINLLTDEKEAIAQKIEKIRLLLSD